MARIDDAADKWERKTSGKGSAWKKGVEGKSGVYAKEVCEFIGRDPSACSSTGSRWQSGVGAVTPEKFNERVRGKKDKWKRKYIEGVTR
ncbi:MAG: hypothetical protein ACTSQJ_00365 [Promethearchaeota archaeon]